MSDERIDELRRQLGDAHEGQIVVVRYSPKSLYLMDWRDGYQDKIPMRPVGIVSEMSDVCSDLPLIHPRSDRSLKREDYFIKVMEPFAISGYIDMVQNGANTLTLLSHKDFRSSKGDIFVKLKAIESIEVVRVNAEI